MRRQTKALLIAMGTALFGWAKDLPAQSCNTSPIASDDTAGHLGAPLTIDVLANDVDADGEPLFLEIIAVSSPCQGDQVVVERGHVRLTPIPPGTPKNCTITYKVRDERGLADEATLTLVAEGIVFWDGFESGDTTAWGGQR